jgi:hypothetical protein
MIKEPHQAETALRELFAELFDTRELKRWLADHYPRDLIHELPDEIVSRAEMSHAAVGLLARRALIGNDLFARLIEARAHRRAEIEAVQTKCSQPPASDRLYGARSRGGPSWTRHARTALICTLVLSAHWAFTRGYPNLDATRLLWSVERGLIGFLPPAHQPSAVPALILGAALLALTFRLLSQRDNR